MTVTETELAAKAVAPCVTLEQLEGTIESVHYFTAADGVDGATIQDQWVERVYEGLSLVPLAYDNMRDGIPMVDLALLTFCVLRLKNGFTAHGVSACADPANYNRDIGERLALADAKNKLWSLLGYELKTKLFLSYLDADVAGDKGVEPQASAPASPWAKEATDD